MHSPMNAPYHRRVYPPSASFSLISKHGSLGVSNTAVDVTSFARQTILREVLEDGVIDALYKRSVPTIWIERPRKSSITLGRPDPAGPFRLPS